MNSFLKSFVVGGVIFAGLVGCDGPQSSHESATGGDSLSPISGGEVAATGLSRETEGVKTVEARVETMTCVAGCFNSVKDVLKKRKGIEKVELAPQKEPDVIDNSVVYISYREKDIPWSEIERLVLGIGFDSIKPVEDSAPAGQ